MQEIITARHKLQLQRFSLVRGPPSGVSSAPLRVYTITANVSFSGMAVWRDERSAEVMNDHRTNGHINIRPASMIAADAADAVE